MGRVDDRDGYHDNLFDGSTLDDADATSLRGRLDFEISSGARLTLSAYRHDEGGAGSVTKNLDDGIADMRSSARDFPQSQDNEYGGVTATFAYTRPAWTLTSLTSVQDLTTDYTFDSDGTAFPFQHLTTILDAEQLSQELGVASNTGGKGQWQMGAFYLDEDVISDFDLDDAFIGVFTIDSRVETESFALFGRYSHEVSSNARVYAGVRYNDDEKTAVDAQFFPFFGLDFAIPQQVSYDEVTGDAGVDFQLSDSSFLYAKYSRGYKSGGFNLPGDGQPYLPEFVNAFEVGIKNLLSANRIRLNASVFHYDYEDMQVFQIRSFQTLIENAAEATIDGVEVELQARLAPGNLLNFGVGYLDAEYDSFVSVDPLDPFSGPRDLAGNQLNRAPELSLNFGIQHAFELGEGRGYLTPRVEYSWQDEVFFRQFNLPRESQGLFSRTDLRVAWDSSSTRYRVEAYVKNIEDDDVIGNMLINATNLSATLYAPEDRRRQVRSPLLDAAQASSRAAMCSRYRTNARRPRGGQSDERLRALADEVLLHLDVAGVLELGQVGRQVAAGESGLITQEDEVSLLDREEARHQHQPGWLVNQSIDVFDPELCHSATSVVIG